MDRYHHPEATVEGNPNSRFAVSWWIIPNDFDYANAWIAERFFESEKSAKEFVQQIGEQIPEMPICYPIQD